MPSFLLSLSLFPSLPWCRTQHNQTTLISPPNAPEYGTVGFDGQNYSCQSGVRTSAAALYVSCLVDSPYLNRFPQIAYDFAPNISERNTVPAELRLLYAGPLKLLINHSSCPIPLLNDAALSPSLTSPTQHRFPR